MPAKGAGMEETAQPAQDEPANDANNSKNLADLQFEENKEAAKAQNPQTPASQRSSGDCKSPMYSCISGSDARERFDHQGTPIQKGGKKHQCRFIDEVKQGANVADVREVKSWKNGGKGCGCSVM